MIVTHRPPGGVIKGLNSFLENIFKKANTKNKTCFVAGNFNLNCLVYNKNLELRTFSSRFSAHKCIPLMTKPTRVTSKTFSLIDNIFTNFIFYTSLKLKKGIIKIDVSDHFPVFFSLCSSSKIHKEHQKISIHKSVIEDTNLMASKANLRMVNWNSINHSPETNSKYKTFFKIFSELYEKHFRKALWISKGLKKLAKQKQKLYFKFLKINRLKMNKSTRTINIFLKN